MAIIAFFFFSEREPLFQINTPVDGMDSVYGAMVVEGVSWTHEDNLALMVANTVSSSPKV